MAQDLVLVSLNPFYDDQVFQPIEKYGTYSTLTTNFTEDSTYQIYRFNNANVNYKTVVYDTQGSEWIAANFTGVNDPCNWSDGSPYPGGSTVGITSTSELEGTRNRPDSGDANVTYYDEIVAENITLGSVNATYDGQIYEQNRDLAGCEPNGELIYGSFNSSFVYDADTNHQLYVYESVPSTEWYVIYYNTTDASWDVATFTTDPTTWVDATTYTGTSKADVTATTESEAGTYFDRPASGATVTYSAASSGIGATIRYLYRNQLIIPTKPFRYDLS